MRHVELIFIEGNENHNKFYRMTPIDGGNWKAEWGRVGSSTQTQIYSENQFEKKYKEKVKKGYRDVTELRVERSSSEFAEIADAAVAAFMRKLQDFSKRKVDENYSVSSSAVTAAQVSEAQAAVQAAMACVNAQAKTFDAFCVNRQLEIVYAAIPRKMKKVSDHLVSPSWTYDAVVALLENEQSMIDAMSVQVANAAAASEDGESAEKITILQAMNIGIEQCDADESEKIKKMMGDESSRFVRAFKVTNYATETKFSERRKRSNDQKSQLLWHGSRNENWLNILKTGLLIRPSGAVLTGAMFGNGVYFANKARKSLGYTSARGSYWANGKSDTAYLALFDVNSGHEYRTQRRESWMGSCDAKKLASKGAYDSLFCKGGVDLRNDELIVYDAAQCTIRYVIEVK